MHGLSERVHVSPNRLEGSLGDTPVDRLLDACRRHLVTGVVRVRGFGGEGQIELRAGAAEAASFGQHSGARALDRMRGLRDGIYELIQQLPDLTGALGGAAAFQGDTDELPLVALMRHCEDNALSCTITLIDDFDRGEIVYRAGEIAEVSLNGERNDDTIVDIVRFRNARFRVTAAPLDLDIEGWPTVRQDPTEPFRLTHLRQRPTPAKPPTPPPPKAATVTKPAVEREVAYAPRVDSASGTASVYDAAPAAPAAAAKNAPRARAASVNSEPLMASMPRPATNDNIVAELPDSRASEATERAWFEQDPAATRDEAEALPSAWASTLWFLGGVAIAGVILALILLAAVFFTG